MSRSDKCNENNVVDNGHDEHIMDNGNLQITWAILLQHGPR